MITEGSQLVLGPRRFMLDRLMLGTRPKGQVHNIRHHRRKLTNIAMSPWKRRHSTRRSTTCRVVPRHIGQDPVLAHDSFDYPSVRLFIGFCIQLSIAHSIIESMRLDTDGTPTGHQAHLFDETARGASKLKGMEWAPSISRCRAMFSMSRGTSQLRK